MTFEEFASKRPSALLRYAAVLTGDRDLAQDVVREVLVRALARWSSIARLDVLEFLSWRRRARAVPVAEVTAEPAPGARPGDGSSRPVRPKRY